jgi:6-phosphogluconate dehydrogenase
MKKKELSDIGMIGLGTMGAALARNIASRSYDVSVYNRSAKKTQAFLNQFGGEHIRGFRELKDFVASIKRPRKIMIMVTAGPAVDTVIAAILPYLQKNDILIDGGNSCYKDTSRRFFGLKKKGIQYIGCGVSGGEQGALSGPSLMPGGSRRAWQSVRPVFEAIAAKDFSGNPCVSYIGNDAAGHYVKMVHNGIEYGVMELIAEAYALLRKGYGLPAEDISKIFAGYNRGKLGSFLFEIAVPVLARECEPGDDDSCLIYRILDKASQKGTGKWVSVDAVERGVAVPSIAQAVFARYISSDKDLRVRLSKAYAHKHAMKGVALDAFVKLLEDALYAAMISIFAQGYDLIARAAEQEKWDIDLAELSRIWEGGCIIRAKLLGVLHRGFADNKEAYAHVLLLPEIQKKMKRQIKRLRLLVGEAAKSGIALPGLASSLFYVESLIEKRLPANVIAGLRDYFGAHGYERVDKPGVFHIDWV